jgi:hypothetical protein
MSIRKSSYFIIALTCLVSCSTHSAYWVSHAELDPASDPNVQQVELVDGSFIIFDHKLGWYDAQRLTIEGETTHGHESIPLARINRVLIEDQPNKGISSFLSILLVALGILIVSLVVVVLGIQYAFPRGCVVAIISVGMMVAAIIILI